MASWPTEAPAPLNVWSTVTAASTHRPARSAKRLTWALGSLLVGLVCTGATLVIDPIDTVQLSPGQYRWNTEQVWVHDATTALSKDAQPLWPVADAVNEWNKQSGLVLHYTTLPCPKRVACINVDGGTLQEPDAGWTTWRTHIDGTLSQANITFDTRYAYTRGIWARRTVTCHELGHAIGLPHREQATSCMYPRVEPASPSPDETDRVELLRAYPYPEPTRR